MNLEHFDLAFNNFSGHVDVNLFSDLKQIMNLHLSNNNISMTNDNKFNVTLPEFLIKLGLTAYKVKKLKFLRFAKQLSNLDLSNNDIQERISH